MTVPRYSRPTLKFLWGNTGNFLMYPQDLRRQLWRTGGSEAASYSLRRGQNDRRGTFIPDQVKMPTSHWIYQRIIGMPRGNVVKTKDQKSLDHKVLMLHESLEIRSAQMRGGGGRKPEGLGSSLNCPVLHFLISGKMMQFT